MPHQFFSSLSSCLLDGTGITDPSPIPLISSDLVGSATVLTYCVLALRGSRNVNLTGVVRPERGALETILTSLETPGFPVNNHFPVEERPAFLAQCHLSSPWHPNGGSI